MVEWSRVQSFVVEVLTDLIEIPTVVPPGERYRDCCEYLRDLLRDLGTEVQVLEVPRELVEKTCPEGKDYPRYIVVGRLGEGSPVLHLNGHYDVVPPGTGWSTDPFRAVVRDGRVYGRGASDMKGGIATILGLLYLLREEKVELRGTLEVSFTPDEEIGGETGVGYLLQVWRVPEYCVIAEPSTPERVWFGHKGLLWFEVVVRGVSAHGSTPWLGVNAFEKMVWVAEQFLHKYREVLEKRRSRYPFDVEEGAKPTICVGGVVRGGAKVNVVPDYCSFTVDRRLIPEERCEEVKQEILTFVDALRRLDPELRVEVRFLSEMEPCITDPEKSILCQKLRTCIREVLGVEPRFTVCIGGLDMRYFVYRGSQAVTYGPGLPDQAHRPDEYIPIENMVKVVKVYYRLVQELLSKP